MSVIYNGTNLEEEFGMVCLGRGTYGAPARDIEQVHVPGRNGDLLIDNGGFLNFDLTYPECTIQEDFPYQARRLRNFLLESPGYHKLTDSYNPGFYRQAEFRGPFAAEAHTARGNMSSVFDLTFNCKPLRYLDANNVRVYLAGNASDSTRIPYFCESNACSVSITNNGSSSKTVRVVDLLESITYTASAAAGDTASISISNAAGKVFQIELSVPSDDLNISIRINNLLIYSYSSGTTKIRDTFLAADCKTTVRYWKGSISHAGGSFTSGYYSSSSASIDSETYVISDSSWGAQASGQPPVLEPGLNTLTITSDQIGSTGYVYLEPRFCIL